MIAITEFHVAQFGLTLPAACVEIKEVNTSKDQSYYEDTVEGEPVMKNTIVRFKVWTSESAFLEGKSPITEGERKIKFTPANQDSIHNIALDLAFPESTIK